MKANKRRNSPGTWGAVVNRRGRPTGLAKNDDAYFIYLRLTMLGVGSNQAFTAVHALLGVDRREIRRSRDKGIDADIGNEILADFALSKWAHLIRSRISSKHTDAIGSLMELPPLPRDWVVTSIYRVK